MVDNFSTEVSSVDHVLGLTDNDLFLELFNSTVTVGNEETLIGTVTKTPKQYFGRMTFPAFIAFCIFILLLFIVTVINCYWDFEYERCAVEPVNEKSLIDILLSKSSGSEHKMSSKATSGLKTVQSIRSDSVAITIDVDVTQKSSPLDETPLLTMDMTQQVSDSEVVCQKRMEMVAAAHSISTSRSERIYEDGTQEDSEFEISVSPESVRDNNQWKQISMIMTNTPEIRTKTPKHKQIFP